MPEETQKTVTLPFDIIKEIDKMVAKKVTENFPIKKFVPKKRS